MAELTTATAILQADIDPDIIVPVRESALAGLLKMTLGQLRTWLLGTSSIDALFDVNTLTTPPTNGQVLIWDSVASLWKPGAVVPAAGTLSYRVGWFYTAAATASEVLLIHSFTKAVTFAANFAGSVSAVDGALPAAALVIDVQKNNASVGSLSISTTGVATFTSAGGTAVSFAIGDRMKLVAPATVNAATLVSGTFEGTH